MKLSLKMTEHQAKPSCSGEAYLTNGVKPSGSQKATINRQRYAINVGGH